MTAADLPFDPADPRLWLAAAALLVLLLVLSVRAASRAARQSERAQARTRGLRARCRGPVPAAAA
ncbi:hypothetical protein [Mangrovicoccus ximenensis]|uniref:hypothetical protein n=1 Tax=Mangrovicoccus ximenensis TaxID=1911570 RepID=UPI000D3ACB3E|nr:hypothetical protein [Mangrovicoccus ximenensis]